MKYNLISITTDFGPGNKGQGIMKGIALKICPEIPVIDLTDGVKPFNVVDGARTLEAVKFFPVGIHVCVVDPGVGTKRKALIIETKRGDILVGPDNGVLIPASSFLGGIKKAIEFTNKKFMQEPVSPVFHGRDIFVSGAAFIAKGIPLKEFGRELNERELVEAPYKNAEIKDNEIKAKVIHINSFGSIFLNVLSETLEEFARKKEKIILASKNKEIELTVVDAFGEVKKGKECIMKDDFGRVEIAVNQGNFSRKHSIEFGDEITLKKDVRQ
jgi:hypothetical protein